MQAATIFFCLVIVFVFLPFVFFVLHIAWKEVREYWAVIKKTVSRKNVKKPKVSGIVFIETLERREAGPCQATAFLELNIEMN